MKVTCIENFETVPTGFLGMGKGKQERIDGLTVGKTYEVQALMLVEGGGNISVDCEPKFLVFDDTYQWTIYDVELFKPEEA